MASKGKHSVASTDMKSISGAKDDKILGRSDKSRLRHTRKDGTGLFSSASSNSADRHTKLRRSPFAYRILIFFCVFSIWTAIYMFSFFMGTRIGLMMEDLSASVIGNFFGTLGNMLSGVRFVGTLFSGLGKMFSIGPSAIFASGVLVGSIAVLVYHVSYMVYVTKKAKYVESRHVMTPKA